MIHSTHFWLAAMLADQFVAGDRSSTYRVEITPELCVGPPGHAFLFGGACLALAIEAGGRAVARPVIQASAQFLRFMPLGAALDLDVDTLAAGKTLAQALVTARIDQETVARISIGLGRRDGFAADQWVVAPSVPAADDCPGRDILPIQDGDARFLARIEVREIPQMAASGKTRLWLRRRDGGANDRMTLAIFGDFLPLAVGRVTGRAGGGNSVDNVLRVLAEAEPGWILCDMEVAAIEHGFAHGDVRLWSAAGKLLATGTQTIVQKG